MAGFVDRWWRAGDGTRLHARDYAGAAGEAKRAVFCLHGLTRNARDFEDLAPALAAQGRRVIAFDVRGRGGSDPAADPASYQAPTYAADMVGWAQALGIGRADLVGTSMGGLIAMALAAAAPALLGDVVLNDIGPEIAPDGLERILDYVGIDPGVRTWAEAESYVAERNRAAFPDYGPADWAAFARRVFRDGEGGQPKLDYDLRIAEPMRTARGQPMPDLWPLFAKLMEGRRVLAVRGARSDLLTPETFARMQAAGAQGMQVDGVGHAPMLDEPQARSALLAFLA